MCYVLKTCDYTTYSSDGIKARFTYTYTFMNSKLSGLFCILNSFRFGVSFVLLPPGLRYLYLVQICQLYRLWFCFPGSLLANLKSPHQLQLMVHKGCEQILGHCVHLYFRKSIVGLTGSWPKLKTCINEYFLFTCTLTLNSPSSSWSTLIRNTRT